MDLGLEGARVLVTAASRGLGAATARRFSLEGATVCISSRNLEALQATAAAINRESGNPVFTFAGDVGNPADAARVVRLAAETMGGLDVLVTNTGGPPSGAFDDLSADQWAEATRQILLSAVNLIRAALPYLRESKRAAVLAVASVSAKEPIFNVTLSNVLRPAIVGLTKTLSQELGPDGIRLNSILPGATDTERITELYTARAAKTGKPLEDVYAESAADTPLRRIGRPEEFANAAVFLCSPAAGYITGVALPVDGGKIRATL